MALGSTRRRQTRRTRARHGARGLRDHTASAVGEPLCGGVIGQGATTRKSRAGDAESGIVGRDAGDTRPQQAAPPQVEPVDNTRPPSGFRPVADSVTLKALPDGFSTARTVARSSLEPSRDRRDAERAAVEVQRNAMRVVRPTREGDDTLAASRRRHITGGRGDARQRPVSRRPDRRMADGWFTARTAGSARRARSRPGLRDRRASWLRPGPAAHPACQTT